jgi:hypothetical protein
MKIGVLSLIWGIAIGAILHSRGGLIDSDETKLA